MTGDKGTKRLVKFWWVLCATAGATAGAVAMGFFGLSDTVWGIVGIGVPIGAAVGFIEWRAERRPLAVRKLSPDGRHRALPPRRAYGYKPPVRRGQLHAITRQKTAEPPSSSGS